MFAHRLAYWGLLELLFDKHFPIINYMYYLKAHSSAKMPVLILSGWNNKIVPQSQVI